MKTRYDGSMMPPKARSTILRLIRSGATVSGAAKEAGVSRQTVTRLLQEQAVSRPGSKARGGKKQAAKNRTGKKHAAKTTKKRSTRDQAANEKPLGELALSVDWRALYLGEKHRLSEDTAEFLRDVLRAEDEDNFLIAATAAGFTRSQIGVSRALMAKYPFEV